MNSTGIYPLVSSSFSPLTDIGYGGAVWLRILLGLVIALIVIAACTWLAAHVGG